MKLTNLIVLGGLGFIAYLVYQKSKTTPTSPKSNTLQVDSKPSSVESNPSLPTSEVEVENETLLSPPNRRIQEQMTDVVMGGGKMCFNAMKF